MRLGTGQGTYLRSLDHLGRSSEAIDSKKTKKVKCDGRTDGRTDGPTKRGVESRSTWLTRNQSAKELTICNETRFIARNLPAQETITRNGIKRIRRQVDNYLRKMRLLALVFKEDYSATAQSSIVVADGRTDKLFCQCWRKEQKMNNEGKKNNEGKHFTRD